MGKPVAREGHIVTATREVPAWANITNLRRNGTLRMHRAMQRLQDVERLAAPQ